MLLAEASSAMCVQRFDGSRNSAIHTTYRISLRSSSLREPRYPLLRVVSVWMHWLGQVHIVVFDSFGLVLGLNIYGGPTQGAHLSLEREGEHHMNPARAFTPAAPEGQLSQSSGPNKEVLGVGIDRFNDPSAGSPTETLLRLLLPLGGRV
jgi:hypothetical protein